MTKQYTGYGDQPYDSNSEAKASYKFAELGCFSCKGKFSQTFADSDGTEFQACPDWYHANSGLYIEYKSYKLNGVRTKTTSQSQLASKQRRKGFLSLFDLLNFGWNHSKRKHAIVQRALTPQNYIVVFESAPTEKEVEAYLKAGLVFIPFSALPSYLLYARLVKTGIQSSFQLHGRDNEVLSLGPYFLPVRQCCA